MIIGGANAGISAAQAIREDDSESEILVLEKGEFISYNTSAIPYYIADMVQDYHQLLRLTPDTAKERFQIQVLTGHEAMAIAPDEKTVMVLDRETGQEKNFLYDCLLLATGGTPIAPPSPGINLPNIFHVRTLRDGIMLKQYIADHAPKKATIIGSSYMGMEMAEACHVMGMEVTILEKYDDIMGTLGNDVSEMIETHLKEHQVTLCKGVALDSFEEEDGTCRYVIVNGGIQRFETDLVILATGVQPEVALARGAGIEIGNTGAIAVNQYAQTTKEHIYAAGDCAEVTELVSGEGAYVPLETTAIRQGWVVGKNFVNPGCCAFTGSLRTMVTKIFDLDIGRTGLSLWDAKRLGFQAVTSTVTADSHVSFFPDNHKLTITLILDKPTKRVLGVEMGGKKGIAKRIDVFAAALYKQMTIYDISQLDLSYSPFYAHPWDPVLLSAHVGIQVIS